MSGCSVRKACLFLHEKRSSGDFFLAKDLFLILYLSLSRLPSRDTSYVAQSLCWIDTAHCTLSEGVKRRGCLRSLGIVGKSCKYFFLLISSIKPLPYGHLSRQSGLSAGRAGRIFPEK